MVCVCVVLRNTSDSQQQPLGRGTPFRIAVCQLSNPAMFAALLFRHHAKTSTPVGMSPSVSRSSPRSPLPVRSAGRFGCHRMTIPI